MSFFDAIFQGILQALTEFLPVSSSGHLAIYNYFFNANSGETLFTILLHIGTLIAVCVVYYKTIWELIKEFVDLIGDIFTGKFKWKTMSQTRRMLVLLIICMLPLVVFVPFSDVVDLASKNILVMGCCYILTGTILMIGHIVGKRTTQHKEMTVKESLIMGIFQGVAILPGVSRSGSTISAGLFLGLEKEYVTKFSFILSIPTILASFVLEMYKSRDVLNEIELLPVIIGIITAAVFGVLAIKLLDYIIKKDKFNIFAIYCYALAVILLGCGIYELASGQSISAIITGLIG